MGGLFASPQHYEKYKARLDKKLAEFRFGFMSDALLPPEHKSQDLDAIARYLERLGKFEMEPGEQSLKIYGYKR